MVGQIEEVLECLVHVVGALHRPHHDDGAIVFDPGGHPVVLDVRLFLVRYVVLALDDGLGLAKDGVGISTLDENALEDVVVAVQPYAGRQGLVDREHGLEGIDGDRDVAERRPRALAPRMRDQRQRLHRVANTRVGEQRLIVLDQEDRVLTGNVAGGRNRALVPGEAAIEVEAAHDAVRHTRAHRDAVEAAREVVVVDVAGRPAQLLGTLPTRRVPANGAHGADTTSGAGGTAAPAHSMRRATAGSMRVARSAGIAAAARPTIARTMPTVAKVAASLERTW